MARILSGPEHLRDMHTPDRVKQRLEAGSPQSYLKDMMDLRCVPLSRNRSGNTIHSQSI